MTKKSLIKIHNPATGSKCRLLTTLVLCLMLMFSLQSQAQVQKVHGKITDSTGAPVIGASIKVAGGKSGAVTDQNGEFTVDAKNNAELEINAVGYATQRIRNSGGVINVRLLSQATSLDEVVVVGYGTQKKVNLTGSVAVISSKELANRPVTNVSSALEGLAAGVSVRQSSGDPRSDGAGITIRGVATLSGTNVLVLVDGVNNWNSNMGPSGTSGTSGIDGLNPDDIESISVLKDAASAAIYGAQAANGVILITTKKGARKRPTVTYNGIFSSASPSGLPHWVSNSVKYMNLINEAYTNIGSPSIFTDATIQQFTNAQQHPNDTTPGGIPNYVAYPNTDWAKALIKKSLVQNHNISVNGGNENTTYNLSLGYLKNPGLIDNSGIETYRFRINVESKIGSRITVGTQTYGSYSRYGLANTSTLFNYVPQVSPMAYPVWKGQYATSSAVGDATQASQGLVGNLNSSFGSDIYTNLSTTWYGRAELMKGLTFEPKVSYLTNIEELNKWDNAASGTRWNWAGTAASSYLPIQTYAPTPVSALSTTSAWYKSYAYTLESLLRYNATIGQGHSIGALVGFNQYYNNYYYTSTSATGLLDQSVPAIGTATTTNKTAGYTTDYSFRSVFGRVTYNYQEKYLFEGNVRRDASSKFGPDQRYGVFPSFSVGWNLIKEDFLQTLRDHNIQNLKLRASWGQLGATYVPTTSNGYTNYQWQSSYGSVPYSFNNAVVNGVRSGSIASPTLHWETTNVTNIGLDLLALKKLNVTLDWYSRYTKGILFTPPVDLTVGTASAPVLNLAEVMNNGLEITAGWNDNIGKFRYSVNGNLGYNYYNDVRKYKGSLIAGWGTDANGNPVYNSNIGAVSALYNNINQQRILEGHMIGEFYMQTVYHGDGSYKSGSNATATNGPKTGMIRTPDDLAWVNAMKSAGYTFAPTNTVGAGQLYYGDLIYADNNGDKTFGNANDGKFMKVSTNPKYVFGLNVNASWKNFSFSMVWSGAAGFKTYWNQGYYNSITMALQGNISEKIANNHYYYNVSNPSDPKNNINAFFPRIKSSDGIDNVISDFWLYNASYLRLKNVQIGYAIPQNVLGGGKYFQRFNVFISAENLLTITSSPVPDPESASSTSATGYPTMKQFAAGVNITF